MPKKPQNLPTRKRGGGKIHRRDVLTDWNGRRYVRLDLVDQGKDLHVYVREGHELATLPAGTKIKIVSGD
jgi:hypothetical protein